MKVRLILAAAVTLLACASSHAECVYPPFEFFPEKNGGVEVPVRIDTGSSCKHNFAEGPGYRFTGITIDQKPLHGTLKQTSKNAYLYTPGPDAKNGDLYAFNICATKGRTSGCALLIFNVLPVQSAANCGDGPPDRIISACTPIIENPEAAVGDRVRALKWRGVAHLNRRQLNKATADFSAAIALNVNDAQAYNNRGMAYQWSNDLDRAMSDYDKAIELDPKLGAAFANRGNVERMKFLWKRAAEDYTQALTLNPNLSASYYGRGFARYKLNDLDGAVADLTKALEIPTLLEPSPAEIYVTRGDIFRLKGDDEKALADYEKAVRYAPQGSGGAVIYTGGYVRRGTIMLERGEFARALTDFDTAIRKNSSAGLPPYIFRGVIFFALGDFTAASADFKATREAKPPFPYASLWLYLAQARSGNADKSVLKEAAAESAWPGPLASFYLGTIPRDQLERAASVGDEKTQRGQLCEMAFYLGEQALLEKRNEDAKPLLKQAAETCPANFLERAAALGELRRLQQ